MQDDGTNGVDPTDADDGDLNNNDDSWTVDLAGFAPDLLIAKSDSDLEVVPGDVQTYGLTVRNVGNIGAPGVAVTDSLAVELDWSTVTACQIEVPPAAAVAVACSVSNGVISFNLGTVPGGADGVPAEPGSTVVARYSVAVANPAAAGARSVVNAATVRDDGTNGVDPTPENNATIDADALVAAPVLDVEKDDGATVRSVGDEYSYTITLLNRGDQDETGVVIADTLPAGLEFVSCTGSCDASAAPNIVWNVGSLSGGAGLVPPNPGSSVSHTLTVRVAGPFPAAQEQITNSVHATDDGANGDGPAQDRDTDIDVLVAVPDLSITKDDTVEITAPGEELTYTLTVTNTGTQSAAGVTVVDRLPAYTTLVSCSPLCDSGVGGQLRWIDVVDTPDLGDPDAFDAGGTATFTVVLRVADAVPAGFVEIVNTASVLDDGTNGADPTPGNNLATDVDTIDAAPDLRVAKSDGLTHVEAGAEITYALTVSNVGNQTATGVVVADHLPRNTTMVSCSDLCDAAGAPLVVWPPFDLVAGATVTRTIIVRLADDLTPDVRVVTNTVQVADDGANGADPTPADNSASDSDTRGVDLAVTKSDGQTTAVPGANVQYTIRVRNLGPTSLTSFALQETLPASLRSVTFDPSEGTFDAAAGLWSGVQFDQGEELTLTVRGVIAPDASGTLENTARVAPPPGYTDINPANNEAVDIDELVPEVHLELAKELVGSLSNNDDGVWRITVTNVGPSTAREVVISDRLPAELRFLDASGDGWTCDADAALVRCVLAGTLAPGASSSVTLRTDVEGESGATITNNAEVIATDLTGPAPTSSARGQLPQRPVFDLPFLPVTGSSAARIATAGAALLVLGAIPLLVGRRSRRA